eukprot:3149500-Rhodomonas_salina.3
MSPSRTRSQYRTSPGPAASQYRPSRSARVAGSGAQYQRRGRSTAGERAREVRSDLRYVSTGLRVARACPTPSQYGALCSGLLCHYSIATGHRVALRYASTECYTMPVPDSTRQARRQIAGVT